MKLERYRINVPWLLAKLKAREWLAERALHMPERYIAGWCELLSRATGAEITPERWRTIERNLAELLYDGVLLRTE